MKQLFLYFPILFFLAFIQLDAYGQCDDLMRGPYLLPSGNGQASNAFNVHWRTRFDENMKICYRSVSDPGFTCLNVSNIRNRRYLPYDYADEYKRCFVYDYDTTLIVNSTTYYEVRCADDNEVKGSGKIEPYPTDADDAITAWVIGDGGYRLGFEDCSKAYADFLGDINGDGMMDKKDISDNTDLVIMLGDNAYNTQANDDDNTCNYTYVNCSSCAADGGDYAYKHSVFDPLKDILNNSILWTTIGNHELDYELKYENIEEFFRIFPNIDPNTGYYSYDYGNAHFVCLNSEILDVTFAADVSTMKNWLINDLSQNNKEWTVVFFHHPVHAAGPRYQRNTLMSDEGVNHNHLLKIEGDMRIMIDSILQVLDDHDVDLVLTGHNHHYERSFLIDGYHNVNDPSSPAFDPDDPTMLLDDGCQNCLDVYEASSNKNTFNYEAFNNSYFIKEQNKGTIYVVMGASSKLDNYNTYFDFYNHPMMRPFTPPSTYFNSNGSKQNGGRGLHEKGTARLTILENKLSFEYVAYDENSDSYVVRDRFIMFKPDTSPNPNANQECVEEVHYDGYGGDNDPALPDNTMAENKVTATGSNVGSSQDIMFQAGNYVELQSMFNVELGAEFSAQIAPCISTSKLPYDHIEIANMPVKYRINNDHRITKDTYSFSGPESKLIYDKVYVQYELDASSYTSIYILNMNQEIVATIVSDQQQSPGLYSTQFETGELPIGDYEIQICFNNVLCNTQSLTIE